MKRATETESKTNQLSASSDVEGVSRRTRECERAGQRGQETVQHRIHGSPYITAQRKQMERCFGPAFGKPVQKKENHTGIPDEVKTRMETVLQADFSHVRVHPSSAKAPEVGALAYTQGSDIHFAPGQFSPQSSSGKSLLGHELTHVVQQQEGRVTPTTKVCLQYRFHTSFHFIPVSRMK